MSLRRPLWWLPLAYAILTVLVCGYVVLELCFMRLWFMYALFNVAPGMDRVQLNRIIDLAESRVWVAALLLLLTNAGWLLLALYAHYANRRPTPGGPQA